MGAVTDLQITILPVDSPYGVQVERAARILGVSFSTDGEVGHHGIRVVDRVHGGRDVPGGQGAVIVEAHPAANDDGSALVLAPDDLDRLLVPVLGTLLEAARLQATVQTLNEIGYALSAVTDRGQLLERILGSARRAVSADAGTLYLVGSDDHLYFTIAQNDTQRFSSAAPQLRIDDTSVAGWAARNGREVWVDDVYAIGHDAPYRWNSDFDRWSGYRTRSMLAVPMRNRTGRVTGVLALINRKARMGFPLSEDNPPLYFRTQDVALARSITAQAAMALDNFLLYDEIRTLFDAFVEASVTTIERRDPTTGGHSKRVATLTLALAHAVNEEDTLPFRDIRFTDEEYTELRYAAILHDFGKVAVREQVLLKAEKLYPWELSQVEMRFRIAALQAFGEAVSHPSKLPDLPRRLALLRDDLATVRRLNRPNQPTTEQDVRTLAAIARRWQLQDVGESVLGETDIERLRIPRGSLDLHERRLIEEHVVDTWRFLNLIPWTGSLKNVPHIAAGHHEKLDGSGYPRGLKEAQIPYGARLMAICDIFDAVTASDRPYREAMKIPDACRLLQREAAQGALDGAMVELFIRRRVWEALAEAARTPSCAGP